MKKQYFIKKLSIILLLIFTFIVNSYLPVKAAPPTTDIFGEIEAPEGVKKYNTDSRAGTEGIGVVLFLATVLRFVTLVAGIWTLINFVFAGWIYITSEGNSKAGADVSAKMTNTAVGLVIIATSYTIAGLISYLIFGDPKFILQPTFQGII